MTASRRNFKKKSPARKPAFRKTLADGNSDEGKIGGCGNSRTPANHMERIDGGGIHNALGTKGGKQTVTAQQAQDAIALTCRRRSLKA